MTNDKFPLNHFFKIEGHDHRPVAAEIIKSSTEVTAKGPKTNENTEFSSDELKAITEALLEKIKNLVSQNKFHAYFANTFTVSSIEKDLVEIIVTTSFIKQIIDNHYLETIRSGLMEILGKNYEIRIAVLGSQKSLSSNDSNILRTIATQNVQKQNTFFIQELTPTKEDLVKAVDSQVIEHFSPPVISQIDQTKTFANFIVGTSNNMAHAFSMAVAKAPGVAYPALYVYGNSGLGKTHLIHAIANEVVHHHPGYRVCISSANKFTNEIIQSLRNQKFHEFRQKYVENVDVLIIDDVHELKNRSGIQDQFFHVFNELMERKKQIVFTSDKPPKDIDGIEERIRTRLSSALPVEIQQPDLETRIAILKNKAVEKDVYLSDEVVNLIARCIKSNIRELEGCLIKLAAVGSILKVDIDLEVAREHLNLSEELENQKHITAEMIAKTVCNYFKITLGDLKGKSKNKQFSQPRQVAMYLIDKLLKPTLKENGQFFGGRDHTTVLYGINSISDRIKTEPLLAQQVLDIEKQI